VLPDSVELKVNVAVVWLVEPLDPVSMLVCGAVVSTVQLWLAGVWSVLPASSTARTWNV
jgi:hypothetical protein